MAFLFREAIAIQIYHLWMQEERMERMDRRGRSHPPRCTPAREGRRIARRAAMDRAATSQTISQHNQSVAHHSVSARIIRRRLHQSGISAKRPLLRLPLTANHNYFRRQWCD
ncbi:transposable element Tc1 transposase [Trichonephila clavipes]|uniref:Transposable element Tc1 transposase n=1 Tax=Trichonephila clavipes TaxID=2585209 RepID=A0A8X6VUL2_TRICX|nr:transposable element Tc1 transposase [Trichonephila clavipes]